MVAGVIRDRPAKPPRGGRGELCRVCLLDILVESTAQQLGSQPQYEKGRYWGSPDGASVEGRIISPVSRRGLFFIMQKKDGRLVLVLL